MRVYPKNVLVAQGLANDNSGHWLTSYYLDLPDINELFGWFSSPSNRQIQVHAIRAKLQQESDVPTDESCDLSISMHLATVSNGSIVVGDVLNDGASDIGLTIAQGTNAASYESVSPLTLALGQYYCFQVASAGLHPDSPGVGLAVTIEFGAVEYTSQNINATSELTSGTVAIANGATSVTVSGLLLDAVPSQILVTIRQPNTGGGGDYVLVGTVEEDSITTDGFTVELSGSPGATGYKMDYIII